MRLLVVDDDADVREALRGVLSDEGFTVDTATDGRHALEVLAHGPLPDVLILDWMMPVMNGIELRRALLADARLCRLPVVFLTADARLQGHAGELRAAVVLTKPVKLDELLSAVQQAGTARPAEPAAAPAAQAEPLFALASAGKPRQR
jgi:CheY-like chemotaxis protein